MLSSKGSLLLRTKEVMMPGTKAVTVRRTKDVSIIKTKAATMLRTKDVSIIKTKAAALLRTKVVSMIKTKAATLLRTKVVSMIKTDTLQRIVTAITRTVKGLTTSGITFTCILITTAATLVITSSITILTHIITDILTKQRSIVSNLRDITDAFSQDITDAFSQSYVAYYMVTITALEMQRKNPMLNRQINSLKTLGIQVSMLTSIAANMVLISVITKQSTATVNIHKIRPLVMLTSIVLSPLTNKATTMLLTSADRVQGITPYSILKTKASRMLEDT
ncbi:hypothetical protein BgiMline_034529 [Biomphalaria glabrata]|nr:hypothetical protein BgiMline_020674 [Biomphalaria glabrata]